MANDSLSVSPSADKIEEQKARERSLRAAALGKRASLIERGILGPVIKRWVNSDVVPIATLLREVAREYLGGNMKRVSELLGNPSLQLAPKERPLRPLMEWCLEGKSPGRSLGEDTTHAEDLALAWMGAVIPRLAASKEGGLTLSSCMMIGSESLRETVQGQFISGVQGAKAMQAIREKRPEKWQQKKSLQRIANQLHAQVMPALRREALEKDGQEEIPVRGSKKVVHVTDFRGEVRRLEFLRAPTPLDWEIMSLCWQDQNDSAAHPHRSLWLAFSAMFLSLAQQTGGWFEVADKFRLSAGRKRKTKMLVLSEDAHAAIARDVERWVGAGFQAEPMLVPPVNGDYLTVKHRKVTGQRAPKGMSTKAEDTNHWRSACLLAESPWRVNEYAPALLDPHWQETYEDQPGTLLKLAAHRRLGGETFYLPINMDFRGRVYYRTPWVTPQSDDLGKSLLRFTKQNDMLDAETWHRAKVAVALHMSALAGKDKMTKPERLAWWDSWDGSEVEGADAPHTLKAHYGLMVSGQTNSIPIQLDGTCNGLQHLSALMRDEVGAAEVNLTKGGDRARDIYGVVAQKAIAAIKALREVNPEGIDWWDRLEEAGVVLNRSLCKGPVMVLPYGGTLEAIRLSVKATVLEQIRVQEGECPACSPWHKVTRDGYGAFSERALADHPLFNEDARLLAHLIHSCIKPVIPKAMAAMDTLQKIGIWAGDRALAWRMGSYEEGALWVVQAKSKASRKQVTLKGYHLPDVIRRLTLLTQTNEIDPRAHRTGIVANFIHSLDAHHLTRTTGRFFAGGGTAMGAIHDCVMCRPSETALMHRSLRGAFYEMYTKDPLSWPVRLVPLDDSPAIEYANWHEIAAAAGASFPEPGNWQPEEVLDSEWFFN